MKSPSAGSAPRRPGLTRGLATLHSDSSVSLLTRLPSVKLKGRKALPTRPVSNLRDYMPPSASRSSWSGMPFDQFERRVRHAAGSDAVSPDMAALQVFLISKVCEINVHRAMLDLPPWRVPNDVSLLRHVCKVWWGEGLEIPELKLVDGRYEIDYEAIERDRETQEILSNTPLIAMSTAEERAIAEAKQAEKDRRARAWHRLSNRGPYGVQMQQKRKKSRKTTSILKIAIWAKVGRAFAAPAKLYLRSRKYRSSGKGYRPQSEVSIPF
ncbi:hypothetical protein BDP27DRAFT_1322945 [Rhodocollybia butyracea]|uniref:Uncharacterized protein n=1 Tax=Rhodocollybia butyracea TaxID=206335 RepID=A0A9P5UAD5_9AGAR|nr:hypothetical protein BDP27DRAFT_1322945 [Rhodocollybia butyracea]